MFATIIFLSHHLNVASHFNEYAKVLLDKEVQYKIVSEKTYEDKYEKKLGKVSTYNEHDLNIEKIIGCISDEDIIITDVCSPLSKVIFFELIKKQSTAKKYVYYDNPETYVPGGYSEHAEELFSFCDGIIFSNMNHLKTGVKNKTNKNISEKIPNKFATGYYPTEIANSILLLKTAKAKSHIQLVYLGGANREYYSEAFPHFLQLLETLNKNDKTIFNKFQITLQQHPRAKKEGNLDKKLLERFLSKDENKNIDINVSILSTTTNLSSANIVLYHQTSMAPQLILAEIEKIGQIGKQTVSIKLKCPLSVK